MDYSLFIFYIRQNLAEGYHPESAVDLAVDRCLEEGILTDILRTHRKEVTSMFLEDFDDEQYHQMLKKEGYKEGFDNGFDNGFDSGSDNINTLVQKLLADNRTDDLRRSTKDRQFQKKLLQEYGIEPHH